MNVGEMDERRRPRGILEQEILMVLSATSDALTPAHVREAVGDHLAYTTVMTVLTRLYDKGLVSRERIGRAFAYRWVPDGAQLTAHQMGRLLDGVDDRAAVLSHFVGVLSSEDETLLANLLHRADGVEP